MQADALTTEQRRTPLSNAATHEQRRTPDQRRTPNEQRRTYKHCPVIRFVSTSAICGIGTIMGNNVPSAYFNFNKCPI
jgi:hypothetical protein